MHLVGCGGWQHRGCITPHAVTQSLVLLKKGQNNCPKHVELNGIINKPLLLHLVGCGGRQHRGSITPHAVTQSGAPEDGQNNYPKHVELTGIINKLLLLHLVGVVDGNIVDALYHTL